MSSRPRYVFDTNTVVSALLFDRSTPGRALQTGLESGVLLLSEAVAAEFSIVLRRPKFDPYVRRERRDEFLTGLVRAAVVIEPAVHVRACRDPSDDKFLELAVTAEAACIVSGDEDLLVLHPFRGIPILTPAQFLEWIGP